MDGLQHRSTIPRVLTFDFLEHITNKFSKDQIVGRGGYGVVYKGVLDNGEEIVVKKLYNAHPGDNDEQFKNECTNLMRLHHDNIVRLIGYCYEIAHESVNHKGKYVLAEVEKKALCFEYLCGGSLDKHLSDESCGLGWQKRYKIIEGICKGLYYLHKGFKDPIYHLDLKPANILLDKNMVPKIGDFGLSRLFDSTTTCTTKGIIGTVGYMPPEYINRYQITSKFDVFSLGVIIIQVMTGREGYLKFGNMAPQDFIELVHENWGKRFQATMPSFTSYEIKTCLQIALRCVEVDRVKRPTITDIVDELDKLGIEKRSFMDQVDIQRMEAINQHMSSSASDTVPALTVSSSFPINPRMEYEDEGPSTETKEQDHKTLEEVTDEYPYETNETQDQDHKTLEEVIDEYPYETNETQDLVRQSGRTLQRFLAWAGVRPTLAPYEGSAGLLWWRDLAHCQEGDLSLAVIQANRFLEDQCCVKSGLPIGTVMGVFDGHGGPEVARFACDRLLPNLIEAASGPEGMTVGAIRRAFLATDQEFMTLVSRRWKLTPYLAAVGSCCLVGIVYGKTLFIANLGDSRAVLGKVDPDGNIAAEQLSREHNVNDEDVRRELRSEHPDDPHIVVLKHNVWRLKGIIQVSRSIGDAYLKYPEFNREPLHSKFRLQEPFSRPIMSANPSITSHSLQPSDRFIIFASDGLWEYLSNQEAVEIVWQYLSNQEAIEIVQKHQRAKGIARRLIKAALLEAALKWEMRYKDLIKIDRGIRRHFHDDITVIVLIVNHTLEPLSIRGPLQL